MAIERLRYPAQVEERYVSLATLDLPHMRTIEASVVGQSLLRETKNASPSADGLSHLLQSTVTVLLARYPRHIETSPCDAYMATVFTTRRTSSQGRMMLAAPPPVPREPKAEIPRAKPSGWGLEKRWPLAKRLRIFLYIMVPFTAFTLGLTARNWTDNQYAANRDRASAVMNRLGPICSKTAGAERMRLLALEPEGDQPWIALMCVVNDEARRTP